jgi:RNA-binding protein YlmH
VPEEVAELVRVVRVTAPKGGRVLTHRDYLGSLLALGLDREVTGDILVRPPDEKTGGGADIIVETAVAEFIEMNYDKAGRTNLDVEILPIGKLETGKQNIVQKHDTVASLRLDNIVSSAFALSRAKAAEAIRRGIVSVNSMEALKVDQEITEDDRIVLRGKGKVVLAETGGRSRKDRIIVTFHVYK